MKTILVPTDFSPNADKALDFAVQIAKKTKAKIVLVHACDLLELTFKDNLWLKKEYNNKIIREANQKLSLYCKTIIEAEKVSIRKKLYHGLVTDTILHAIPANKADLVVMGTLGNAAVKERIFGSKTAGVIGKTNTPVLAVPLLSEWKVPGNILFAINNFSEGKAEIVRPLIELAEMFRSTVTVVKFSDRTERSAVKYMEIERDGQKYTEMLQAIAPRTKVKFVHLEGRCFEKDLEKYISANQVDLLTMIGHKRSMAASLFHRSMTKKMAYHSEIRLLALHVPKAGLTTSPAQATRRRSVVV